MSNLIKTVILCFLVVSCASNVKRTPSSLGTYCAYELSREFNLPKNFEDYQSVYSELKTVYCRDILQIQGPYFNTPYDTVFIGKNIKFTKKLGLQKDRQAAYDFMESLIINGRSGNSIDVIFQRDFTKRQKNYKEYNESEVVIINKREQAVYTPRGFTGSIKKE